MAPPLQKWRVTSRKNLTHDVFELRIARPEAMNFQAGQYISIVIPGAGPGGRNLRRAYSIASPPEQNEIELCVKLVEGGPGTNYLNKLREGDEFEGQAPFGDFVLEHDQKLPTLFIGTGTGLAPLRSMILSKEWAGGGPLAFLLGVREERDIIYPELFGSNRPSPLADHEHVKIALSRASDQWKGFKGRVTDYLRSSMSKWDFGKSHTYLCGNGAMIAEIKELLMGTYQVPKEQIHMEKYY